MFRVQGLGVQDLRVRFLGGPLDIVYGVQTVRIQGAY